MKKTSNILQIITAITAAATLSFSSVASAANDTKQAAKPAAKTEQETVLEACDFMTLGLVRIAQMRQSGLSKAEAKKNLGAAIKQMTDAAPKAEKQLAKDVGDFWQENFEALYGIDVMKTDAEKDAVIGAVYQQSMNTCISELGQS